MVGTEVLNEYNGFVRALNLRIDRFPIKFLSHYYFNAEVVVVIFAWSLYREVTKNKANKNN